MSIASPFDSNRTAQRFDAQTLRTIATRPVETAAFWLAVLLPVAYPALLVGGLGGSELGLLAALVVCNALALVLGRDHKRDGA